MTFVVMGLGTVFNALTNRRDPTNGLSPPILQALAISLVPVALVVLATQLPGLQAALLTAPLTGPQWLGASASHWCCRWRSKPASGSAAARTAVGHRPERSVTPGRALAGAGQPSDRPNQHRKEDENHEQEQRREDRDPAPDKLKRKEYEAELAGCTASWWPCRNG